VPGEQGARRDREDLPPPPTIHQPGEGGEPEPIGGLVADRTRKLSAQDRILVLQHEQLGVLHHLAAQQHRRHGQQLPGDLVQQGHDHPDMLSSGR